VVVSHAGVEPDREILKRLPRGAVMIGGHDHLSLNMRVGEVPYVHAGSWGSTIGVIGLGRGAAPAASVVLVDDAAPQDPALAALADRLLEAHLAPADREVIARLPRGMDLAESALFAVEAVRAGLGADVALLGHTGFGASLAPGPLTRFDFDSWFRFDGDAHVAEIEGNALRRILTLANQHEDTPLERRTGDFLYAPPFSPEPGRRYRVAVADWTALHQRDYLGSDGHDFRIAPGFRIKPAIEAALRRLGGA
jgi:2',3'-cyclic-nucleotide 2'-phosphodiesterase (5'-nucleotidase family)